jgi:hypothetical protein
VLPIGMMHLAFREMSAPACSVAAVLRPGAAQLLFDAGADELAGRHTRLHLEVPDLVAESSVFARKASTFAPVNS